MGGSIYCSNSRNKEWHIYFLAEPTYIDHKLRVRSGSDVVAQPHDVLAQLLQRPCCVPEEGLVAGANALAGGGHGHSAVAGHGSGQEASTPRAHQRAELTHRLRVQTRAIDNALATGQARQYAALLVGVHLHRCGRAREHDEGNCAPLNDLARTRRLQRTCSYGGRAFAAVAVPHNEIKVVVRQQVRDVRLAHRSETDPTDRRLVVGRHCLRGDYGVRCQTVSNTYRY